jgi:ABC transport system ATP-binding/permease protein
MLAQRGADIAGRAAVPGKKPVERKDAPASAPVEAKGKATKRRLSFNDKHALDTLPKRMTALQKDIARLQAGLADPGLYSRDPKAFADTTAALGAAQTELAQAEEKWLELEILREEIDGG